MGRPPPVPASLRMEGRQQKLLAGSGSSLPSIQRLSHVAQFQMQCLQPRPPLSSRSLHTSSLLCTGWQGEARAHVDTLPEEGGREEGVTSGRRKGSHQNEGGATPEGGRGHTRMREGSHQNEGGVTPEWCRENRHEKEAAAQSESLARTCILDMQHTCMHVEHS